MADSKAIRAGKAFVELFADDSKLVRGLKSAERKLKAWGASLRSLGTQMAGAGAAVLTPLVGASMAFAQMGDNLDEMSQRTGVSVEVLSEMGYAANLAGVEMETLEGGLRKMQKNIVEAAKGSQSAKDALSALGLSVKDLTGLSPDAQFKLIADRLSKVEDPAIRAAQAMEILGKTGTSLLPMMVDGAAGIDILMKKARDLGLTISTEDAKAAAKFADQLDSLWKVLKHGVFVLGGALAPVLSDFVGWVIGASKNVADWIKQHKELIVTVAKVAAGVVLAGIAFVGIGYALSGVAAVIGGVIAAVGVLHAVFGGIVAVLGFMISPIGLVIAGVVALGSYILKASGAGGAALKWLGEGFGLLVSDAKTAFGGIADALAAGNISLAGEILWSSLKVIFKRGMNTLTNLWIAFRVGFGDIMQSLGPIVLEVLSRIVKTFIEAGFGAAEGFKNAITNVEAKRGIDIAAQEGKLQMAKIGESSSEKVRADFRSGKISRDEAAKRLKEIQKISMQGQAEIQANADKQINDLPGMPKDIMKNIGEIWSKPLPPLDTKKFTEALSGIGLTPEQQKEVADANAELQKLIKDRDELVGQAAAGNAAGKMGGLGDLMAKVKGNMGGLDDLMARAAKISVSGTFNAAAAAGLGAGSSAERTAKATEKTAENTKKIGDIIDYGWRFA